MGALEIVLIAVCGAVVVGSIIIAVWRKKHGKTCCGCDCHCCDCCKKKEEE